METNDADEFPKLGAKALLKAAEFAAQYSNVLLLEDPDDEDPIRYWSEHANLLRKLADEWSASRPVQAEHVNPGPNPSQGPYQG